MNWYKKAQEISLYKQLLNLRPSMVVAAQTIYDEWQQNEEGTDEIFGAGGICSEISNAIGSIIVSNIENINITEGGQDGDDHSWIAAYNDKEAYGVDIPPNIYESGGGYSWKKLNNIIITPDDVIIWKLDIPIGDFDNELV